MRMAVGMLDVLAAPVAWFTRSSRGNSTWEEVT